jgi:hypothetical protein
MYPIDKANDDVMALRSSPVPRRLATTDDANVESTHDPVLLDSGGVPALAD